MNPAYRSTRFRAELPRSGVPVRFGIVTACNPDGAVSDAAQNEAATAALRAELQAAGACYFPVTGGSPDFSHAEPGFGIVFSSPAEAIALGQRWRQEAVFWVEYGEVSLHACKGGEVVSLGSFLSRMEPSADKPRFHFLGDVEILRHAKTALFSSAKCPGDAILRAQDCAAKWRDEGRCVVSGFHSPLERECLRILLGGKQPIIVCPARAIPRKIPDELRAAIGDGRLLVLSPFGFSDTRISAKLAEQRNEFVASLAESVWFAHVTPGGSMERLASSLPPAKIRRI